jgi:uncharacterized membrane protein YjfL (UPF0719 family)
LNWERLLGGVVEVVVFVSIGLGFFALSYFIIQKISPFSLRKEIEEDQNVALGIVLGAVAIAIAIIVGAAIIGPTLFER